MRDRVLGSKRIRTIDGMGEPSFRKERNTCRFFREGLHTIAQCYITAFYFGRFFRSMSSVRGQWNSLHFLPFILKLNDFNKQRVRTRGPRYVCVGHALFSDIEVALVKGYVLTIESEPT